MNIRLKILIGFLMIVISYSATCPTGYIYSQSQNQCVQCFYGCDACSINNYYSCTICKSDRGYNGVPVSGMCYCSNKGDEDLSGNCIAPLKSQSYRSAITAFIILILLLSIFTAVVKSNRFFLFRLI